MHRVLALSIFAFGMVPASPTRHAIALQPAVPAFVSLPAAAFGAADYDAIALLVEPVVAEPPLPQAEISLQPVDDPAPPRARARTPRRSVVVTVEGDVELVLRQAAEEFGVDPELLVRIAACESGLNPLAKNRSSTASGLLQFLVSTWERARLRLGYESDDIWNPVAQARTAASMIAEGGISAWNASRGCWG